MSNSKQSTQPELKTSVVGVDLGSAFTKIAAVEKGVVEIITNEANLRHTPTIIGYGSKERLIGEAGSVKIKSNLSNSIVAPQRVLGVESSEYLQEEGKRHPCHLKQQEGELVYKVNCQGQEAKILPEQAVAAFFSKVQQIVELNGISNKFLTVAVPNYLTHIERQSLLDSLEVARRSSKQQYGIQLVNESTAVGLDYGFYKKTELPEKEEEGKNVLFVDFGHSKLSLYLIRFTKHYQKVVYQNHLRQLGCRALDERMMEFYSELFEKNNPNLDISVKESKKATLKLLENIEKQRKILTGNSEYDFNIDCLLEESDLSYTMTRQQFQAISEPVIAQVKQHFLQSVEQLKAMGVPISSIELIGGGSRIPLFIRTVAESFGVEPQRTLNSSECIARGAGLFSAMSSGLFRMQAYYSVELSPQAMVCSWKGEGEELQDQANSVSLLSMNEPLFSKKTLEMQVNVSDSPLLFTVSTNCPLVQSKQPICSFKVSLPSGVPQRKLKLSFQFNLNNMVSKVSASELKEEGESALIVSEWKAYEHLSQAKINELAKVEREQMLRDIQILQHYENKNKFESKIYELKERLSSSLRNSELKDFINPITYNELSAYFSQLQNDLDAISNFDQQLKELNIKLTQFHQQAQQNKKRYMEVQKELAKFEEFINAVVGGKGRKTKQYPKEEVEAAQNWLKEIQEQQNQRPKYEPHVATIQQIYQRLQALKECVQKMEQEAARAERLNSQQFYHQQTPRHYQERYQQDPFYPFATSYEPRPYDLRNRGRGRNSSFNGYNSGMFSGFPGFF